MIEIRTRPMPAPIPIVVADAPEFAHGLMADNPIPVPSLSRKSEKPADAMAPPAIAAQDTAEAFDSVPSVAAGAAAIIVVIVIPSLEHVPVTWSRLTKRAARVMVPG
jgi:hypothetical protein